ncbi:MAG: hypothetical protein ACKV0T_23935 [Planctomycetales bacterium]
MASRPHFESGNRVFILLSYLRRRLRKPTLIELLTVIAIVFVVLALVLPKTKWASSGYLRLPVRVLVFDAVGGTPLAGAEVAIFRAPPLVNSQQLEAGSREYDSDARAMDKGTTGADGTVVIEYEFRTGANHERPTPYAHLTWAWVHVRAPGYGGVVVPVRHDSQPTSAVRGKELVVPVGVTTSP